MIHSKSFRQYVGQSSDVEGTSYMVRCRLELNIIDDASFHDHEIIGNIIKIPRGRARISAGAIRSCFERRKRPRASPWPILVKFASWNQRACRAQVGRKIAGGIRKYANGPSGVVASRVITPAGEAAEACSITSAEYLREIAIVSHFLPRLAPFSLHRHT